MIAAGVELERWTDRESWGRFVAESEQGSIFCQPAFLDALDRSWEVWRLPSTSGPRAAAVVFRNGDGTVARSPLPFCLYQGILLSGAVRAAPAHRRVRETLEAGTALIDALAGQGRMSWCLHPTFTDVRALSWFHYDEPEAGQFRLDVRYTGIISVDPAGGLESVLQGARSVRRQEHRKAAARFSVERSADVDVLDRLHDATFARQGIERNERERALLRSIAVAALREGFGELLVARDHDGTAAGAVLFLFDQTTAYYLVAANDPAYRSAGVSTLLLLSGIQRGIDRGVSRVDVVGMNSPSRGDFKASFAAEPVPYFVANWERP